MRKMRFILGAFLALAVGAAQAQTVMQLGPGEVLGNNKASRANGQSSTLTSIIDRAAGSARGSILMRNATVWAPLVPGTAGLPLLSGGTGADLAYGILGLSGGGCNAALTASNGGILYSTASACAVLPGTATAGQMLRSGSSAAPSWSTATWPATAAAGTILSAATANVIAATAQPVLGANGGTGGQVTLNGATSGSGILNVAAAAGAGIVFTLPSSPGANGYVLQTNGSGVTSWISPSSGGTVTSVGFTGGLISVGTPTTTPAFTVAGTSGGIPYFDSSSSWASSAALAANSLVKGGGAGVAPSTITTGAGVLTALGVNVGSAGAFVTFNGALGTPSSGTLTSATGLPISTGVAGLGTGIATALAVNTGTAGAPAILIAKGTSAMGTGAISSATCATVVTTSATGVATTDTINASFNGDPSAVTGYVPLTTGMLTILAYPSTNNVNFKVCNNTAASITPGAITLNWIVAR